MTFHTQALKDAAIVVAQNQVNASQGQAKVDAQETLVATEQAQVVG